MLNASGMTRGRTLMSDRMFPNQGNAGEGSARFRPFAGMTRIRF
jgi:hypothetical protein